MFTQDERVFIVVLVPIPPANASGAFSGDYVPKLSNHMLRKLYV